MKNQKLKGTKGITLIALVITVIVLLILAGVTIATLSGPNGILSNAQKAKEQTAESGAKEKINIAVGSSYNNTGSFDSEKFKEEIQNLGGSMVSEDEDTIKVSMDGYEAIINKQAGDILVVVEEGEGLTLLEMYINGEKCETANCTDPTHLHIGDYVEGYTPSNPEAVAEVGKEETGYEETEGAKQKYEVEDMTWRVLGLSEDGKHVLLTSGSPMKKTVTGDEKPYLIMQGAEGYIYCEDTLEKICKIYANTELADEVRSITIEDINRAIGVELGTDEEENKIVYRIDDSEKTNIDQMGVLGNVYNYRSGNYAPENYLIDMAKKEGKTLEGITEKYVGDSNTATAYYYDYTNSQLNISSKVYDMLFKGTTMEEKCSKAYWLASPGVYAVPGNYAYFGPGAVYGGGVRRGYYVFDSGGYWYADGMAVRPVVSLKSNITENQIKKSENQNQAEENWTYDNTDSLVDDGWLEGEDGKVIETAE